MNWVGCIYIYLGTHTQMHTYLKTIYEEATNFKESKIHGSIWGIKEEKENDACILYFKIFNKAYRYKKNFQLSWFL